MRDIFLVHRKNINSYNKNRNRFESAETIGAASDFPCELQHFAIWKTCLRKMLFCREDDLQFVQAYLSEQDEIIKGEKALSLLLEILCGLHSPVIGETEVFGQFKSFVETRKKLNDVLFFDDQKWLKLINTEVKMVRSNYLVGIGSQSYGSILRRRTKGIESTIICGSGQLALEILPWMSKKKLIQIICRSPHKLQEHKGKFRQLHTQTYDQSPQASDSVIIASPLSDEEILRLIQKMPSLPIVIFDLRGEENILGDVVRLRFPTIEVVGLQKIFDEIKRAKKNTEAKVQEIKKYIFDRVCT